MEKIAGDFSATGVRQTVPGSSNTFIPGKTVLASRVIPAGAKAILEYFSAKVVDIGSADQIYFAITRNGIPIQSGVDRIPGLQFDYQSQIRLGIVLLPGLIEIIAYNISGMLSSIEPDAIVAATDIRCQAYWVGALTSERGGIS